MFKTLIVPCIIICIAVIVGINLTGCDNVAPRVDADKSQAAQTKQTLAEADREIGMPAITNFQERRLMKMILELRDQADLVTYAYIVNLNGDLIYLGQCVGYGLPYSTQFTNPERVVHQMNHNGGSFGTLPQADPNGLFMPTSSSATWLMMVQPNGEVKPVYVEPEIIVSPFRLR